MTEKKEPINPVRRKILGIIKAITASIQNIKNLDKTIKVSF